MEEEIDYAGEEQAEHATPGADVDSSDAIYPIFHAAETAIADLAVGDSDELEEHANLVMTTMNALETRIIALYKKSGIESSEVEDLIKVFTNHEQEFDKTKSSVDAQHALEILDQILKLVKTESHIGKKRVAVDYSTLSVEGMFAHGLRDLIKTSILKPGH